VNDLCLSGEHLRGSRCIVCLTSGIPTKETLSGVPIAITVNSLHANQLLALANALAHDLDPFVRLLYEQSTGSWPEVNTWFG